MDNIVDFEFVAKNWVKSYKISQNIIKLKMNCKCSKRLPYKYNNPLLQINDNFFFKYYSFMPKML